MRIALIGAAIALSFAAVPATAALVADYQLNGSLADAIGGPDITNNGGTLGASGISFGAGQGPSLGGFANTGLYSVEVAFRFDNTNGYRRILDFKGQTTDTGLYVLSGALNFYNITTSPTQTFTPNMLATVVFTRDLAGNAVGYVNGNQEIAFVDGSSLATITSVLNFFNDDFVVGGEQSAGFVDFIRIYDSVIVPTAGVPEPATWAMMIGGFGLVGGAMRRRVAVAA